MCKRCGHGEPWHYDYHGSDGQRTRGCSATDWGQSGAPACGCPGFKEEE